MDRRWGYGTEQRLRDENQDTHGVFEFPGFTLAIVCDGMGGHHGGAHASALAVRTIHDSLRDLAGSMSVREALIESVRRANQAIYDASRRSHRLMGMGTTVAAVAIEDSDLAHVVHVGDSRVYLVRGGEARQLTRDHTMVNLFVEAELLSPEDAASHPEAHVLSRSLGVERQVEVEVQDPIHVEYADTFVLCTDGVHGVLTEWEFGKIDWGDPQEGVWEGLRLVAAREGDDNASLIGVIVGEFDGAGRPATPPPEVDTSDEASVSSEPVQMASSSPPPPAIAPPQLLNSSTLVDIPATPAPAPIRETGGKSFAPPPSPPPAPTDIIAPPPPMPIVQHAAPPSSAPQAAQASPSAHATPAADKTAKAAKGKKKGQKSGRAGLFVGLAVVGLGVGVSIVGAAAWLTGAIGGADPQIASALPPPEVPLADPMQDPAALAMQAGAASGVIEEESFFFAPRMPEEQRRPPHRPQKWVMPPPGGPDQLEAILTARNGECGKSLGIVQLAMVRSVDHATLYDKSWDCFDARDQQPLMMARARDFAGLAELEKHFGGVPPEKDTSGLPRWFRPPTGGLEYRMEAWNVSGDRDKFTEVMLDRKGEDTVADTLLRDLWLEATAAASLAKLQDPSEEAIEVWARRVYFAHTALEGRVGRLVKEQRPEIVAELEALLAEGLRNVPVETLADPKATTDVPDEVRKAWSVALGYDAAPGVKPGSKDTANAGSGDTKPTSTGTKPKKPRKDEDEDTDVPLPRPKIHRAQEF